MSDQKLSSAAIERAAKLSYSQAMLSSVYAASTGGMFIIGYALQLGATNVQLGLMTTIPMFAVLTQLLASMFIERGASRRRMTILASILNVSGWLLIILLPYAMTRASEDAKIAALIGVIALVTIFSHMAGNARGSWIGDLIPEQRRGLFFGKMIMYSGIIGAVFAIIEGAFLDRVKSMGIGAFSWLFAFGMVFGLISALLFIPQSDVKAETHSSGGRLSIMIVETFKNRALLAVMAYGFLWGLQAIAGPFGATYVLRDLKVPFLGLGLVNSMLTITLLASSSFWGRVIDRYGCKPVLMVCTVLFAPANLIWLWIDSARAFYILGSSINVLVGFAIGGISVSMSALLYKVTPSAGRSAQLAVFSTVAVVFAAPMPFIGGHLPGWLHSLGIHADLRCTFYACVLFAAAAAYVSRYIQEPGSRGTSELVSNLPGHIVKPDTLKPEE